MPADQHPATEDVIRRAVADRYSAIGSNPASADAIPAGRSWAERLGYSSELLDTVPTRALDSFTGIGAPVLWADLSPGDRVLDLGCGAGLDSIVMARMVAPGGQIYGVDLAPGMVATARQAVAEADLDTAAIIQAPAEHLPLPAESVDVAVVNGLFNLSPDKAAVAAELHRVLRRGGRLVGAEIVIIDDRPPGKLDLEAWFR